jgi:thioredoxin-like negative regulator of GroEL
VKLLVLYRPESEHSTDVESFVRDFQRQYEAGNKIELVSLNTRDGAATASLYDIMSYPAILVLANDGSVINLWQGLPMPLMDEVAGYAA